MSKQELKPSYGSCTQTPPTRYTGLKTVRDFYFRSWLLPFWTTWRLAECPNSEAMNTSLLMESPMIGNASYVSYRLKIQFKSKSVVTDFVGSVLGQYWGKPVAASLCTRSFILSRKPVQITAYRLLHYSTLQMYYDKEAGPTNNSAWKGQVAYFLFDVIN